MGVDETTIVNWEKKEGNGPSAFTGSDIIIDNQAKPISFNVLEATAQAVVFRPSSSRSPGSIGLVSRHISKRGGTISMRDIGWRGLSREGAGHQKHTAVQYGRPEIWRNNPPITPTYSKRASKERRKKSFPEFGRVIEASL
jgi:hypothetical protein